MNAVKLQGVGRKSTSLKLLPTQVYPSWVMWVYCPTMYIAMVDSTYRDGLLMMH